MTTPSDTSRCPTWVESPELSAFRDRVLRWTPEQINTGWEDVLVPLGAAEAGEALGDADLRDWARNWLDAHDRAGIRETARFLSSGLRVSGEPPGLYLYDYCGNWGAGLVAHAVGSDRGDSREREILVKVVELILRDAVRGPGGVILHAANVPAVWVDTLFYCAPVFARAFSATEKEVYAKEAVSQCRLHAAYLRNSRTGGWHHDANSHTRTRTASLWSRGQGWALSAMADVLKYLPPDYEGVPEVLDLYRSLAEALVAFQHDTGLWRTDPMNPASHLETSGSTMVLQGLCVGIEYGWLDPLTRQEVERGYRELRTWIHPDGRLMGSQSCSGPGGWDQLKLTPFGEDTYTTGFFLRLLAARARLDRGDASA